MHLSSIAARFWSVRRRVLMHSRHSLCSHGSQAFACIRSLGRWLKASPSLLPNSESEHVSRDVGYAAFAVKVACEHVLARQVLERMQEHGLCESGRNKRGVEGAVATFVPVCYLLSLGTEASCCWCCCCYCRCFLLLLPPLTTVCAVAIDHPSPARVSASSGDGPRWLAMSLPTGMQTKRSGESFNVLIDCRAQTLGQGYVRTAD